MKSQFIQHTSGWIPVCVMTLLAIALIAGQARANLPGTSPSSHAAAAAAAMTIEIRSKSKLTRESVPALLNALRELPATVEMRLELRPAFGYPARRNNGPATPK